MMRVGTGFDVHRLVEGRKLILGGVEIEWHKGLDGHSDADVLIHAVCDALLGAAGMGDIGIHFPPGDSRFSGIDSRILLREVRSMLDVDGWHVENIDCTIIAEKPKLSGFIPQMIINISEDLDIQKSRVNIKATTTEQLGFAGREEGMAAQVVALISNI